MRNQTPTHRDNYECRQSLRHDAGVVQPLRSVRTEYAVRFIMTNAFTILSTPTALAKNPPTCPSKTRVSTAGCDPIGTQNGTGVGGLPGPDERGVNKRGAYSAVVALYEVRPSIRKAKGPGHRSTTPGKLRDCRAELERCFPVDIRRQVRSRPTAVEVTTKPRYKLHSVNRH